MPDRIYIETSIVSYLTGRPSRDIVIAGHQQTTHQWWDTRRASYELFTSEAVLEEAASGDPEAAQDRLDVLNAMKFLATTAEAMALAEARHRKSLRGQAVHSADHLYARRAFGSKTMNDPFIDEIRQYRDAHAARFNYDLKAIYEDIKRRERSARSEPGVSSSPFLLAESSRPPPRLPRWRRLQAIHRCRKEAP